MDLKLTQSRGRRIREGKMSENGVREECVCVCMWDARWEVIQTKQAAFLNRDQ